MNAIEKLVSKREKLMENQDGFNNLVPMVLAVVITFALIFVGVFVIGVIQKNMFSQVAGQGSYLWRTQSAMNNSSKNFDSVLSVVNIAVIITVLAAAIGAIFLFTRIGG